MVNGPAGSSFSHTRRAPPPTRSSAATAATAAGGGDATWVRALAFAATAATAGVGIATAALVVRRAVLERRRAEAEAAAQHQLSSSSAAPFAPACNTSATDPAAAPPSKHERRRMEKAMRNRPAAIIALQALRTVVRASTNTKKKENKQRKNSSSRHTLSPIFIAGLERLLQSLLSTTIGGVVGAGSSSNSNGDTDATSATACNATSGRDATSMFPGHGGSALQRDCIDRIFRCLTWNELSRLQTVSRSWQAWLHRMRRNDVHLLNSSLLLLPMPQQRQQCAAGAVVNMNMGPTDDDASSASVPLSSLPKQRKMSWEVLTKHRRHVWLVLTDARERARALAVERGPPALVRRLWSKNPSNAADGNALIRALYAACPPDLRYRIDKDTRRTITHVPAFSSPKEAEIALAHMLGAYATLDAEVNYCQGMNLVAARVLSVFGNDEYAAFCMIFTVMNEAQYDLRSLFLPGLVGIHLARYQFLELLRTCFPRISRHFINLGVFPDIYVEWFMTAFSHRQMPRVLRIAVFDLFLVHGYAAIHAAALAVMYLLQDDLLAGDLESVVRSLKRLGTPEPAVDDAADGTVADNGDAGGLYLISPTDFLRICLVFLKSGVVTRQRLCQLEQEWLAGGGINKESQSTLSVD